MKLCALFIFIQIILIQNVFAVELTPVSDKNLKFILNNFEIVAEAKPPESKGMWARLLKVSDIGECDGTPQSCPKSTIYLSISSYDEYPEDNLYILPKMHYWKFIKWKHLPARDGDNDFIIIELKAQKPTSVKTGWWKNVNYEVRANYKTAELIEKSSNK